ncbi:putative pyrimidine 5 -nucleotidase [Rosellinia necatrix]|uniref:Putative pyrimidine 5-nucleotidase n=1 Tax=Rosellinia necatrix TaxID=77044 RepID=A0A1W2TM64_ROSNE|nr:putative pyrimidine 5 -nucleotidase [Rosellinia necatrix]
MAPEEYPATPKKVFFFDIDNCLYPASAKVHHRMADLIHDYFERHLNLPRDEAVELHSKYYKKYGLAIGGLMRFHDVDPLHFNSEVDDALPLDDLIRPRIDVVRLLQDVDRSKVKLWLFTNAYVNHARRVVKIMGIDHMFDGLTYCDYTTLPFVSKPQEEMFAKAMMEAGAHDMEDCYFVDDNYYNCSMAEKLGWNSAHLVEDGVPVPAEKASKHQISHLEELRRAFPQLFKATSSTNGATGNGVE